MKIFTLVTFLALLAFVAPNPLEGMMKVIGAQLKKAEKITEKISKNPKTQLVLQTGVSTTQSPYPVKKVKPKKKKKPVEMKKFCNFPIRKSDVLMVTLIKKKPYQSAVAFKPIILDNRQLSLSFYTEKDPGVLLQVKKILKYEKGQLGGDSVPLHLKLDRKMLGAIPPPSPDDIFVLTIIKQFKKGKKMVASHFVDVISVQSHKKYPYA